MTTRLGIVRSRRKVGKSRGKWERMIILMGLLIGSRNEAVSAMKVQANRNGGTGSRSLVTRTYTIGVRIKAVASFERTIEIKDPNRKTFRKRPAALLPASWAAFTANQSKKQAASARADSPIIPRKKRNVFQSLIRVEIASPGEISPRMRRRAAPAKAMTASFHRNGRVMIPAIVNIPTEAVSQVLTKSE